jgi:hypothetical protein
VRPELVPVKCLRDGGNLPGKRMAIPERVGEEAVARALADLAFAAGSAGLVAPLGLLLAGVTVPALILRLVPRPLGWAGLAIAVLSLLSAFTLLTSALDATLPVGRSGIRPWPVPAAGRVHLVGCLQ